MSNFLRRGDYLKVLLPMPMRLFACKAIIHYITHEFGGIYELPAEALGEKDSSRQEYTPEQLV